jgi:hypothetical protein
MNLSGRLHSNKDIYLDAESGATLKIDSTYLRSAGNIYNRRKNNGGQHLLGNVSIRVNQEGNPVYRNMNESGYELDCNESNWTTESQVRWQGSVESAVHGVTKLTAPSVASTQPSGYYATNANVVIENGVLKKGGVILTEGVDYPPGTITTDTDLFDKRENKYIKATNIDVEKLSGVGYTKADGTPYANNLPSNGLLYATRNDAGSYEPGIRLINGATINQNTGLTVVSNDPVYIQGNFNTNTKKPAAVISDSLNLLSNNWNDANSTLGKDSRIPTQTTYNCAFISGIKTTTDTSYNGGLENYPRLHEKWTGVNLNITGSFVALWNSSIATGNWSNASYSPPLRNWAYDTAFNNTSNLPPFTPMAVEAQRIAWWKD